MSSGKRGNWNESLDYGQSPPPIGRLLLARRMLPGLLDMIQHGAGPFQESLDQVLPNPFETYTARLTAVRPAQLDVVEATGSIDQLLADEYGSSQQT